MKSIVKRLLALLVIGLVVLVLTSFGMSRTELISTSAKYQLKNDIERGDEMAIKYYEDVYTSKGIYLFGEE